MKNNKGILEDKLKNYYSDVNLSDYKANFIRGIEYFKGRSFSKILDIGSGVGSFEEAVMPFNVEVFALEASDYGYETCIKKGINCKKFILEKGKKLPFKDNFFSMVFMNQVIEHLTKDTGKYYIEEILRVLEPGGVAIINSPSAFCRIWKTDPHHIYCWKPNELKETIEKHSEVDNVTLLRNPLEPWMFVDYNEQVIDSWHKYNKHPIAKKVFHWVGKIIDKILFMITGTDRVLSSSNVIFIKKS